MQSTDQKQAPVDIHFGGLIDTLQRDGSWRKWIDKRRSGKQRSCVEPTEYGNRFIAYMMRMFPSCAEVVANLSVTGTATTDAPASAAATIPSMLHPFRFDAHARKDGSKRTHEELRIGYETDIKNKIEKMVDYHSKRTGKRLGLAGGGHKRHRKAWNKYQLK